LEYRIAFGFRRCTLKFALKLATALTMGVRRPGQRAKGLTAMELHTCSMTFKSAMYATCFYAPNTCTIQACLVARLCFAEDSFCKSMRRCATLTMSAESSMTMIDAVQAVLRAINASKSMLISISRRYRRRGTPWIAGLNFPRRHAAPYQGLPAM